MEVISLNTNKQKVAIVDSYKSFIWNDRYEDLGDFELYIPAGEVELLANIHQDYFIQCSESDRTMIVEKVNYKTDFEDGNFVTISGHSLESILKRRIVWNDDGSVTQVNATKIADPTSKAYDSGTSFPVWAAIEYLLKLYIIEPENCGNKPQRQIPDFVFQVPEMTDDIYWLVMPPCSYQGDNLYDVIRSLCDMFEISFKITLDNETGNFVFSLYKGVSHLASQTKYPYVCFSHDFDNLNASDFSLDMSTYRNMAYYKGQGSKYVVKEFSEEEITMETGYVRIKNNKVWAVNTSYGQNEETKNKAGKKVLDWTPDEFNEDYDKEDDPPVYTKYNKGAIVARTEIGGALLTEDRSFYITTEPETPPEGDEYTSILLWGTSYDAKTKYFRCINNSGHQGPWNSANWEQIDIRVTWGDPTYPNFDPGTVEEPKEHKVDDIVKYNNKYWKCIEKYSGAWDASKWIEVITYNVLKQSYLDPGKKADSNHSLWEECEDWVNGKQYSAGNFITFNDATRTGKITIYRKTQNDVVYSAKKKYQANSVVWYTTKKTKTKPAEKAMYIRKNYKAGTGKSAKKGVAPTNTKYWTKIKDKYKVFAAQNWEALDDIEVESYDIFGSVQDNMVGGLNRREIFVDASAVTSSYNYFYDNKKQDTVDWLVEDGVMQATIKDMALAELTIPDNRMTKGLDAEIEYETNFQYRKDYNIGDVIEVRDIYGYYDSVRVKEFIISNDDNGPKCYPVFESVEASTITTRLLEVNDELKDNTILVKIPEDTRFNTTKIIAVSVKDENTYYLKSFVKRITTDSEVEPGKKVKRDLHIVAWVTTDDIYTEYEEQAADQLLKSHPTMVGEPLFYIDVDADTKMKIPGILFPSWAPPYGTDLGVITEVHPEVGQYSNILLANI